MFALQEAWLWSIVLLAMLPLLAAKKPSVPRFKWGQDKERIYLSVIVRDLDQATPTVAIPSPGEFSFRAKDAHGEDYALDLELREDVKQMKPKWEIAARPDKWGIAVFCTLNKVHEHRWDLLVTEPKKYKDKMDKDWTREDQTLEPEDEVPYADDHAEYIMSLTSKNEKKIIEKYSAVVANVRYPWCSQCKSQDDAFANAAKIVKARRKKDAKWKKMAFALVDAREERKLARRLDATCDYACKYQVFTGPGEDPISLKASWNENELLENLDKFLGPAVHVLKTASEVDSIREKNTTCVGKFTSDSSPQYLLFKKIAGRMRGELMFAVVFGEEAPVELWPHGQSFSFKYDGSMADNGTSLLDWMKPRSIPLLQEYDWQLREKYEQLELPLARVWIDDKDPNPSLDKTVRHVVRRLAKKFIGKMAFIEVKKSSYSYELRDYGLNQPEVYPAFGIASNASYNAAKYGFEITSDIAETAQHFWKDADPAVDKLTEFCEKVLAGSWEEAHETGPAQTNWTKGMVRNLVWKNFKEMRSPEKPLLLEMYGKYRQDHETRSKEVETLANVLDSVTDSFTVGRYDTSDNFLPTGVFKRDKYSSDTEWYWIPAKTADSPLPKIEKLMKPKKDAPLKNIVEFAAKQSGADFVVEDIMTKVFDLMADYLATTTTTMAPIVMDDLSSQHKFSIPGMTKNQTEEVVPSEQKTYESKSARKPVTDTDEDLARAIEDVEEAKRDYEKAQRGEL